VKVAKSRVADRNIGLPAFQRCYSLDAALNRLATDDILYPVKIRLGLVGGGCIPLIPPLDPPLSSCMAAYLLDCQYQSAKFGEDFLTHGTVEVGLLYLKIFSTSTVTLTLTSEKIIVKFGTDAERLR